eukprot:5995149-Amphidinium_carterae.1
MPIGTVQLLRWVVQRVSCALMARDCMSAGYARQYPKALAVQCSDVYASLLRAMLRGMSKYQLTTNATCTHAVIT